MAELVASAKARTLKSGLIQIVAEILRPLGREGVLDRDDAWEYLANARESWKSPEEVAAVASVWPPAQNTTMATKRMKTAAMTRKKLSRGAVFADR